MDGGLPHVAGRGEPQRAWEAPRAVAEKLENRRARLRALGNAVHPEVAYHVGLFAKGLLE